MKDLFAFLKSKYFFIHFTLAIVTVSLIIFALVKMLNVYTQHNETVEVPDFKGKTVPELKEFINGKDVRFQIIDSIYAPKEKPGCVIRQDPEPKTLVKHNRTIYLYVTGMLPPSVVMPKLIDRSERQAVLMLESYGLKIGKRIQVAGDCSGCVLAQTVKGKDVEPGVSVPKGTVIDITIGKKENFVAAPDSSADNAKPNFE